MNWHLWCRAGVEQKSNVQQKLWSVQQQQLKMAAQLQALAQVGAMHAQVPTSGSMPMNAAFADDGSSAIESPTSTLVYSKLPLYDSSSDQHLWLLQVGVLFAANQTPPFTKDCE